MSLFIYILLYIYLYYLDNEGRIDTLAEMQSERLLHDTHYLRYWALDTRAHDLLEKAKEESFVNNQVNAYTCYNNALEVLLEMERLLLLVLPEYHHEKVIHYDKLAQTCVALGNTQKAKEYFTLSYQHRYFYILHSYCCIYTKLTVLSICYNT